MKRIIFIISILLTSTGFAYAQMGQRGERIHAIKVGYLTDRLHLNSSQAAAFWPVYNDFEQEHINARKAFRQKYRNGTAIDNNEQAGQYIDDNLDFQEQMLSINKKYKEEFLKIISPQQLAALYDAERDFKKLLIQQLRERRGRR